MLVALGLGLSAVYIMLQAVYIEGDYTRTRDAALRRRQEVARDLSLPGVFALTALTDEEPLARWRRRAAFQGIQGLVLLLATWGLGLAGLRQLRNHEAANTRLQQEAQERQRALEDLARVQDLHRALLEHAPALIWRAGTDAKCDWFNATWLGFTGRTLEQEFGDGWAEGVHPEDLAGCLAIYLEAFAAQRAFAMDYRLRNRDGAYRWIADHGLPYHYKDGTFAGYIGYCFDITEHRETVARLQESERMFRDMAGNVPGVIFQFRVRPDGTTYIQYLNDRSQELFGFKTDPTDPGWQFSTHIPEEDRAAFLASIDQAVATVSPWEYVGRIQTQTGETRWIHGKSTPMPVEQELVFNGILMDITGPKRAEEETRKLSAQLQQAQKMESMGSLAGGLSHDINNVLAAILSLSSAHRLGLSPEDPLAKALDTITHACERGRDVVRRLLYFARKDLDTAEAVDLNGMLRELAQLLDATSLKKVRILTELQEPLEPVAGDLGALSHALMNLGINALDAMPDGGTLRLGTSRLADGTLQVTVQDTGEGMTAEVKKRAMEPFFTTKPLGKGTGLGLAMVYGTMMSHRGTLDLASEPGHGTVVTLNFPPAGQGGGRPEGAHPETGLAVRPPSQALRILLVDDDDLIRASVAPLLQILGHEVRTAEGGLEALEALAAWQEVDLVILDMNMPGLNGAQTLPRLLALRPGLTVLMATGYSDADILSLQAGRPNVHSIRKPFSLEELQGKLTSLIIPSGSR
jgi:PAS domain S-box-containing protein